MSVAAGAKVALKVASAVSGATDKSLKHVFVCITAAIGALILLIAAVISIVTSPIDYLGPLGDLQNNYGYIVTNPNSNPGTGSAPATVPINSGASTIDNSDVAKIVESISDPDRKILIETGLSLLGKVGYFWGGKSAAGWNNDWGKQKMVTSQGSRTTGTYRPYGLDCSGFVDWCYKTADIGDMLSGGGTSWQWGHSYAIAETDLLPGDLVLQNKGSSVENHIGLYVGRDANGSMLFLHCAGSSGVVLNSYSGFKYFRRVAELDS